MNRRIALGLTMFYLPLVAIYAGWVWAFGWKAIAGTVAVALLVSWYTVALRFLRDNN